MDVVSMRSSKPALFILQPGVPPNASSLLELNSAGTRVERSATLPPNPANDWTIECDEENGYFIASATLGQSSWVAWPVS